MRVVVGIITDNKEILLLRKNNPDWAKIDKMISEREALEDKYRDKELKFETNYAKK